MTDKPPDRALCLECKINPARPLSATCSRLCSNIRRLKARAAGEPPIKYGADHMRKLGRRSSAARRARAES